MKCIKCRKQINTKTDFHFHCESCNGVTVCADCGIDLDCACPECGGMMKDENEDEPLFDVVRCRECGCTWDNACPGGCYWVEEDLCSRCAAKIMGAALSGWHDLMESITKEKK